MKVKEINLNVIGNVEKFIAKGDQCTYCGKKIDTSKPDEIEYAKAIKRYFPVCSSECENEVAKYVENDKKHKKHFYTMLTVCAFMTLIGAITNHSIIAFIGVIIGGLSFMIFPYPITSFETFVNNSIKTTTKIVRVIGALITIAGLFFLFMVITGHTTVSFYN